MLTNAWRWLIYRESYVRKLKRDEDRQAAQEQAERAEEEAVHKAMTTQESAGPSGHDSDTDTETDKLLGLQRATGQNPPEASNGSNAAVANRRHSGDQTGRFQPKKKKKEGKKFFALFSENLFKNLEISFLKFISFFFFCLLSISVTCL